MEKAELKAQEYEIARMETFNLFGTSSSTVSQKAAKIRTMLKLKQYRDSDFSTRHMQANNPYDLM